MTARKGKPLSDAEKAERDRTETALKKLKTEQAGEEAGAQGAAVEVLYTKNGKPLMVYGDNIFDRSGRQVGRRSGGKVYGPDGKYAGTIESDRVLYRSVDSATLGSPFAPQRLGASGLANAARSGLSGEEPFANT